MKISRIANLLRRMSLATTGMMSIKSSAPIILAAGLSLMTVAAAQAQTSTATAVLAINATIASTCSVVLSQPGTLIGAPGSTLVMPAAIGVSCSVGAPYSVVLGNGNNADATGRRLKHTDAALTSNNFIPYAISGSQAANTIPSFPGIGTGSIQNTTIWIRAIVPQSAATGTYADTVMVTVTY